MAGVIVKMENGLEDGQLNAEIWLNGNEQFLVIQIKNQTGNKGQLENAELKAKLRRAEKQFKEVEKNKKKLEKMRMTNAIQVLEQENEKLWEKLVAVEKTDAIDERNFETMEVDEEEWEQQSSVATRTYCDGCLDDDAETGDDFAKRSRTLVGDQNQVEKMHEPEMNVVELEKQFRRLSLGT